MTSPRRRLVVIGAGYVGLVTSVGMASLGHQVRVVEARPDRLEALRRRLVPIHEEGLQAAFESAHDNGSIVISDEADFGVDAALVCVGTPIDSRGRSDLSELKIALAGLAPLIEQGKPIVIRSTLPPGVTRLLPDWSGVATSQLLTNPEFLRQGTALSDFMHPARIVIGTFSDVDPDALATVVGLYDRLPGTVMVVSVASAELIKNGSNAFLALKLSFANEIASLSEQYGADIDEVLAGITADPRIGAQHMRPALGFGGSCLPKELMILEAAGVARGLEMHVTAAASSANAASQARFVARLESALGGLEGRRVALLGLAFKAGTDDVRESPALGTAARIVSRGAEVIGYDPAAAMNARRAMPALIIAATAEEAVRGADAVVIATEWPEFASLDWAGLRPDVSEGLIVDGRRLLDGAELRRAGYRYLTIGTSDDGEPLASGHESLHSVAAFPP